MESTQRMKIGALARKTGLRVRTLRFYEERGLILPLGRTAGGYRLYGPQALEDVAFLKGAKRLGLRLGEISELLKLRTEGRCPCGRTRELVRARLEEVEVGLREVRALRDELRRTVRSWEPEPGKATSSPCVRVSSKAEARG